MLASPSLNHLIRPRQQRGRDREADGLGGLEVDDQLECGGLPDGKITGLRAFEDAVNVAGSLPPHISLVWPISDQAAPPHVDTKLVHGRKSMAQHKFVDAVEVLSEIW